MKKMMLVDGNSLLFRGFYATIYGRPMKTSEGIYTNAVFAFANMLNKAISMIEPDAILVAFDSAKKNFRHELYSDYKGGRSETPIELIGQFAIVREYLDAMNICRYEQIGIEADDIIGSVAKKYPDWQINVLTSDQDMLQLIDPTTSIWLLKKGLSDIEKMDEAALMEKMSLTPKQIIDYKGLAGDKSDNIPGVPKIGEKTAVKLLNEFNSLEEILERTDELKGKMRENIIEFRDQAILSKTLATIKVDAEIPVELANFGYEPIVSEQIAFFQKYEMNSMIQKLSSSKVVEDVPASLNCEVVKVCPTSLYHEDVIILMDIDCENPYISNLYGLVLKDDLKCVYLSLEDLKQDLALVEFLASDLRKVTYDKKLMNHVFNRHNIEINSVYFDTMISAFLCKPTCSSIEKIQNEYETIFTYQMVDVYGKENKFILAELDKQLVYMSEKSNLIAKVFEITKNKLKEMEMEELFYHIEMPLTDILYEMEHTGVLIDQKRLDEISVEMKKKVEEISLRMSEYCEDVINFNSPKQLATLLFDQLGLPANKKRSTSIDILEKLQGKHPIIDDLMDYRKYQKIVSTYSEGLKKSIFSDGCIHTIYNQCVTQTGRLSSVAPNLQNISVRDEEGRMIRSAFIPRNDNVMIAADYSQIELRVLAHMAKEDKLISTFNSGIDVHTKTACDLFDVTVEEVTSTQRRHAKTVNFGIVYGISDYGLAEQLQTGVKDAQRFIEKYLHTYPNISIFMDSLIEYCKEHGYVKTLMNRRREIPEIYDKNYAMREFGKRAAMNAPIQGTAADLIKIAMIRVDKKMKQLGLKSKMILQVHDELIFDVLKEEQEIMIKLIKEEMESAMKLDVSLLVQIQVGKTWYEAK